MEWDVTWSDKMSYWGEIGHPDFGMVKMYYERSASDTYSQPSVDDCGDIFVLRYDHDEGVWKDWEYLCGIDEVENYPVKVGLIPK